MVSRRRGWLLAAWTFTVSQLASAQVEERLDPTEAPPDVAAPAAEPPAPAAPPDAAAPPSVAPSAEPTSPEPAPTAAPRRLGGEPKPKSKGKGKGKGKRKSAFTELFGRKAARGQTFGHVQPTGRVFVRTTLARHYEPVIDATGATRQARVDSLDLSIPSARAGLVYDAPVSWLRANLELELTGK